MCRALAVLVAFLAVGSLSACDLFCEDADLSCGGPAVRESPSCGYEGTSCNDGDYARGLFLRLPALADGTYVVAGNADAEAFSCTVTVTGGVPAADCPTLPYRWMGGSAIEFDSTPCQVELELRSGEGVVLERTVRPHYEWSEPWGEGCDWAGSATEQL
jgi:hypothetical protein